MATPELFDSEWAILQVVWDLEPCAAPAVQEVLAKDKGWAYTTVKTLMDRMVKKGLLQTERIRNLYLYRSVDGDSLYPRSFGLPGQLLHRSL